MFENLNAGEERVLSYIMYSKLAIFGEFKLKPAKGIYEKDEKIYETKSNAVVISCQEQPEKKIKHKSLAHKGK